MWISHDMRLAGDGAVTHMGDVDFDEEMIDNWRSWFGIKHPDTPGWHMVVDTPNLIVMFDTAEIDHRGMMMCIAVRKEGEPSVV